jgi:hypothetical protein
VGDKLYFQVMCINCKTVLFAGLFLVGMVYVINQPVYQPDCANGYLHDAVCEHSYY